MSKITKSDAIYYLSKYQDTFEVTWKHIGITLIGLLGWAAVLFGLGFIFN
ncbi:MAG: hypothetical protein ACWGNI_00440 [Desulfobacterales bacterium]